MNLIFNLKRPKKTYMNTILFNIGLILFTSFSVTQFCVAAFDDYVTFTDINLIFSVQIRYLVFFVYFYRYHVFEYILLGIAIISLIYLACTKDTERFDRLEVWEMLFYIILFIISTPLFCF